MRVSKFLGVAAAFGAAVFVAGAGAHADSAALPASFAQYANPYGAVAAIQTTFDAEPGKSVRISVYNSEETFLEEPFTKLEAPINAKGLALVPLGNLAPGQYAFAAYLDENGDGVLNRGKVLGRPKEPIAFSNGAKAKLRRPYFDEAKVDIAPGEVVVMTLED